MMKGQTFASVSSFISKMKSKRKKRLLSTKASPAQTSEGVPNDTAPVNTNETAIRPETPEVPNCDTGKKKSKWDKVKKAKDCWSVLAQEKEEKPKEPSPAEKQQAFRLFVYDTMKSVFDLVTVEDRIHITVDNIFPLMKQLEIDGKDEAILDLVRTSCIETFGDIDECELDKLVMEQKRRVKGDNFEDDIRSAFVLVDVDDDGFITISDLYQLMMGLGEMLTDEELAELIKMADDDQDGQISYSDFKYFLTGERHIEESPEEEENKEATEEKPEDSEEKTESEPKPEEEEKKDEEETKQEQEEEKDEEQLKREAEERERLKQRRRSSLLMGYLQKKEDPPTPAQTEAPEPETKDAAKEKVASETNQETTAQSKKDEKLERRTSVQPEFEKITEEDEVDNEQDTKEALGPVREDTSDSDDSSSSSDDNMISVRVNRRTRWSSSSSSESLPSNTEDQDDGVFTDDDAAKDEKPKFEDESIHPTLEESFEKGDNLSSKATTTENTFLQQHPYVSEEKLKEKLKKLERIRNAKLNLCTVGMDGLMPFPCHHVDIEPDDEEVMSAHPSRVRSPSMQYRGRQRPSTGHSGRFSTSYSYCEAGVAEDLEDEDKMDLDSYLESALGRFGRSPLRKLQTATIISTFDEDASSTSSKRIGSARVTSPNAKKIENIKRLQSKLLKRQSTAPEFSRNALDMARQEVIREKECSQIRLDLNIQCRPKTAQAVYRPYSARRPRTAMSFRESQRKSAMKTHVTKNYDSGMESPDTDDEKGIKIINLSNSFLGEPGYLESPELSTRHHGYKSVRPLARVVSATNQKYFDGKGLKLDSISRRLERQEVPKCWRDVNELTNSARVPNGNKDHMYINPECSDRSSSTGSHSRHPSLSVQKFEADIPVKERTVNCKQCERKRKPRQLKRPQTANSLTTHRNSSLHPGIVSISLPFRTDSRTRYKRNSYPHYPNPTCPTRG